MSKARDLANFVSTGNPLADGTLAVADISDLTASAAEINVLDGVTASTAELNIRKCLEFQWFKSINHVGR